MSPRPDIHPTMPFTPTAARDFRSPDVVHLYYSDSSRSRASSYYMYYWAGVTAVASVITIPLVTLALGGGPAIAIGHCRPSVPISFKIVKERPDILVTYFVIGHFKTRMDKEIARYCTGDNSALKDNIRIIKLADFEGSEFQYWDLIMELSPAFFQRLWDHEPITCLSGQVYPSAPKPSVCIVDCTLSRLGLGLINEKKARVWFWSPASSSGVVNVLGPPELGGNGNILQRAEKLAEETNKSVWEAMTELLTPSGQIKKLAGLPPAYDYEFISDHGIPGSSERRVQNTKTVMAHFFQSDGILLANTPIIEKERPTLLAPVYFWMKQHLTRKNLREGKKSSLSSTEFMPLMGGIPSLYVLWELRFPERGDSVAVVRYHPRHEKTARKNFCSVIKKPVTIHPPSQIFAMPHANTYENLLPPGLRNKLESSELALVAKWAPQQTILRHPATGACLIHGGQGSITESLVSGVIMIIWPLQADQPYNAMNLTLNLKVAYQLLEVRVGHGLKPLYRGYQPKGTKEAIEEEFRRVLGDAFGQDGEIKRKVALDMSKKLRETWQEGGEAMIELRRMSKTAASLATKIAHTSTLPALGNKDLRLLQDVIINEKAILTTMQKLAMDFAKASESLKSWGLGEGDDLSDVLTHSASIFAHLSGALNNYANHEHSVRAHLKTIRTREEKLDELKRKRKNVASKADAADKKLSKMSGENKNLPTQTVLLNQLRDEIRQLDTEIVIEETKLSDFKRLCTRNFMALKFGGLFELGEKATIIGELGKLLIEEIPLDPTPPGQPRAVYQSYTKTTGVVDEVSRCIAKVVFNPGPEAQISADVYDVPSGMARPSDEATSPVDTYPSQYHVTNYGDTTRSTLQSQNTGPPANEFGESLTPSKRFGSQAGPGYTPSGPDVFNNNGSTGGGQFNTFPIKNRPPALAAPELGRDSFGADVTYALRYAEGESAPLEEQNDGYNRTRSGVQADEDSHLPYTRPEQGDERNNDMAAPQSGVRFRTPSMEASGRSPVSPGVDSPTRATSGIGGVARRSRRKVSDGEWEFEDEAGETFTDLDVPEEVGEDEEEHAGHTTTYDHNETADEMARNAAAAREIALEMDKLEFPMPPISSLPQQPEASPSPSSETRRYSQYSAVQLPEPQSYSQQEQQQPQLYYSQVNTQPPQYTPQTLSHRRTPSPLTQGVTPFPESGGISPYRTESPQIPPSSPIVTTPIQSPGYYTPISYSPAASASNMSIPTAVGGPRTITAAAFKRGGKDGDQNRRRFLPASPRPSVDSGPGAPADNTGSPYHQGLPAALTPGGNQAARAFSREPSSPTTGMDYGTLGHVRVTNATNDE
ncbi:hypothetical protein Clacol_008343 [Clathrus columnatus]|uniref:Uncharacterized protein n=1 Tax=Clathrus columnatus TaxID=1419009 RepID=A0AAV5AHG3_9AGAM|nr:hypothetical protein Clacol_008343 [Clathrus columnatus]